MLSGSPRRPRRLLIALAAILAMVWIIGDLTGHPHSADPRAQAIETGQAKAAALAGAEAEDQNLSDDEEAAGALWARRHLGQPCPIDPAPFRQGCADFVNGRRR